MRLYHHSVSVATLGVTLHLFTARKWQGWGGGGSQWCPQPGTGALDLKAVMKHPGGISGLGVGKASGEVPRGRPSSHRVCLVGKLLHSVCELSPGLGQVFSLAEGSSGPPGTPKYLCLFTSSCLSHTSSPQVSLDKGEGKLKVGRPGSGMREVGECPVSLHMQGG